MASAEGIAMSKLGLSEDGIRAAFGRLAVALEKHGPLPCENGPTRVVPADEFMLMCHGKDGRLFFKHRVTRNYVIVLPDGVLQVPSWDMAFHKGVFNGYPEAVVEVAPEE